MSKNLKDLNELNEDDYKNLRLQDVVMYYLVPVLEDQEKRLKTVEAELGIYTDEEIEDLKIGGTDSD